MKLKYGSEEANIFTKQIGTIYCNEAHKNSAFLAKEKGSFLLYDKNKIFDNGFINNILFLFSNIENIL